MLMAHLTVHLTPVAEGIGVTWRLDDVELEDGAVLAQIVVEIAGTRTVGLDDAEVRARDASGDLPLVATVEEEDGESWRRWRVGRRTSGSLTVSYLAVPSEDAASPGAPPIDLRREGEAGSGALKSFVALPPGPSDLAFVLRCDLAPGRTAAASSGEGADLANGVRGTGLTELDDVFLAYGDVGEQHHRDGNVSVWWLTPPPLEVEAFVERLGATYDVLVDTFAVPAAPYRVFLRSGEHRGITASAHPASFVVAVHHEDPPSPAMLHETIAHELVHEWVHLDGLAAEVTWFVEGAADYYSLVVPHRHGLIDDDALARAVKLAARECWASPLRGSSLAAARQSPSDLWARRLPYGRGLFYLADLDARLRAATSGRTSVDDVVRTVVRRRGEGLQVEVTDWCALVDAFLLGDEASVLDAHVLTGRAVPSADCFGLVRRTVEVPVVDLGFAVETLVTRRVQGLVAGGPADRAGLRDGDAVELPTWRTLLGLGAGDTVELRLTRAGEPVVLRLPVGEQVVAIPQWGRTEDPADPPAPR